MTKITKLFMTFLLLLVAGVVNAAEESIYTIDYSTVNEYGFWNGSPSDVSVSVTDGALVIVNDKVQEQVYSLQLFVGAGIETHEGYDYKVKIDYKSTVAGNVWVGFGGWSNRPTNYGVGLTASDEYQTLTLDFNNFYQTATDNFVMWQSGSLVGTVSIKKVEVIEIAKTIKEPVWTDITNGDGRCFLSKEYPSTEILPAKFENDEYVVNSAAQVEGGYAWDSQFWIRMPQTLEAGKKFKIAFDYKASAAVTVGTLSHAEPGSYIDWHCLGELGFTGDWQTYDKVATVPVECEGKNFQSIAFNLTQENQDVAYYFKNIKIEVDEDDVTLSDLDFYLAGSFNEWAPTADYKLVVNEAAEGVEEYMITLGLKANDELKVVKGKAWYPAEGNNFMVSEDGNYTIYFRPEYNGGDDWFAGCIYAAKNPDPVVEQEFSATFKNDADPAWEAVYAYAWSGDGDTKVEQLGAWPGIALTANAETGLFEVSGKNATLPEFIIFHNNNGTQTANLAFEEGKEYCYWGEHEFAYQKYVFVNVASEKCWGTGNNWDTQASLVDHPVYQKLVAAPEGKYKMETQVSNGGTSYWFGGEYMDSGEGAAVTLTITRSAQPLGYKDKEETQPLYAYTIANGDNFYGNNTESTLLGTNVAADSQDALWVIVPLDEAKAAVADAALDDPSDATIFIEDYNFNRNNRYKDRWNGAIGNNDGDHNGIGEWYMTTGEVYQELSGLPNGVYEMNAQGAVTFHDNRTVKEYDGNGYPVVYAGEETSNFVEMIQADQLTNQAQLGQKFNNGDYKVEPIFVEVTDGTLKIGAKSDRADIWACWDNFTLTYYGSECTILQAKNQALFAELKDLYHHLSLLLFSQEIEIADLEAELLNVLETNNPDNITTEEAARVAIEALTDAINRGEASIMAKSVLPQMKQLTESTNVYTAEAYDEYYGQWFQKYEAGTLTKAEAAALQDPFIVTGWHASITCDNFLLSAWDTNPDFNNAAYYINTWSTEGVEGSWNYAGVPFGVPFFEYWTDDANSLGEKTLTATMSGLTEGFYKVSALVRVRGKNDFTLPAYGITLQANNGKAINVVGERLSEDNNFYMKNVEAYGYVGEDGVLYIKFNVAADNNISWLSFKDVKFEATAIESMAIVGDFTGGWDLENGAAMTQSTEDPAEWTLTINNFEVTFDEGQTERTYEYKAAANGTWDLYELPAEGNQNWRFATGSDYPAGKYQLVFTANTANHTLDLKVTDMATVGISSIAAEAQKGNIYNLNGQRVMNAQKGLYIMNGKKVVLK